MLKKNYWAPLEIKRLISNRAVYLLGYYQKKMGRCRKLYNEKKIKKNIYKNELMGHPISIYPTRIHNILMNYTRQNRVNLSEILNFQNVYKHIRIENLLNIDCKCVSKRTILTIHLPPI